VSVNAGITRSAREVLTLAEGYVLVIGILVALRQPEIDDVNVVLSALSAANQEIIWLDISMNDAFLMDLLDTLNLKVYLNARGLPFAQRYEVLFLDQTFGGTLGKGLPNSFRAGP
jgi:hypothetical protein